MNESLQTSATSTGPALTLDDLFRRTVARQPDEIALTDPPNKQRVTGQPPVQLTFAQADQAVSAIAAQFTEAGIPIGSVIAMQMEPHGFATHSLGREGRITTYLVSRRERHSASFLALRTLLMASV